mmetsp:Transcript_26579/g.71787  ORF Transcript_26579/g.71787 Transcript_26579/m.71787 type:complete len:202 (-) Transcript_26579:471-1076(-)
MPARRSSSWHGSTTETCPTAHACSPPSMTQSPTGFPSPCAPRPTRRPWRPSLRRWGTLVRARFASLQETWSQTRSQRRTCTSSRQRRWTCSRASASSSRTRTSASARRSVPRWPAPSPSPSTPRTRTSPPQMPCGRTSALWISISCRSSWRLTRPNSCMAWHESHRNAAQDLMGGGGLMNCWTAHLQSEGRSSRNSRSPGP